MTYVVVLERVAPRPLAAARCTTTHRRLSADIRRLLDLVWPALRAQRVATRHNVVVYHNTGGPTFDIEAGVETLSTFTDSGQVVCTATPGGEVARTAHHGEYSDLARAYAALEAWCSDNHRLAKGVTWEVYGDWADNPAQRRTDVFFLLEAATPEDRSAG